jgi:hypothetical protein
MQRAELELADIFREYGPAYRQMHRLSVEQLRAMRAIEICRTSALGGHVDKCENCEHTSISYNSCRNRHCPKCQNLDRAQWLMEREEELLPIEYYHVVFTLPNCFSALALLNKRVLYNLLFKAVSQTLIRIAADPKHLGAQIGFTALLHTWDQKLRHHPHCHCIVTGGGLSLDQTRFIKCRKGFLFPVRVLSRLFRRLFLSYLRRAFEKGELQFYGQIEELKQRGAFSLLLEKAEEKEWVVYSKAPMGGPAQVLKYLGQYTHRTAISNSRLVGLDNEEVSFTYRDSRDSNQIKTMSLRAEELISRFLLHILPEGLQRIRHYGLLSNLNHQQKLERCRYLLGVTKPPLSQPQSKLDWKQKYELLTGKAIDTCPACGKGRLIQYSILVPMLEQEIDFGYGIDSS